MPIITTHIREILTNALHAYYETLNRGDLQAQSTLMTKESYILNLEAFGLKRAFKDSEFKKLLKTISDSEASLRTVETILSSDLQIEAREHKVALVSFESKGPDRVTVHYSEDGHPKKLYFSASDGEWKIDYRAGRQIA